MAQQPNPKKVAALIAATKAKSGGRKVVVRKKSEGPQAGMPGSGKMAELKEVTITASPIEKKKPEAPVGLISISQFGGGSKTYLKDDVVKMLNNSGMSNEANAIKTLRNVSGDMSDVLNKLIGKKGIKEVTK